MQQHGQAGPISRGQFLRSSAAALAAFAVAGAGACTPLRIATRSYNDRYDDDEKLIDRTLRAFVGTVIPGAPGDDKNLVRAFGDNAYPFRKYRGFFTSDLDRRAKRLFRSRFVDLAAKQRASVVEEGLNGGAIAGRLYRGAVMLAQVSFYAGIYDDDRGCPLINFGGANEVHTGGVAIPGTGACGCAMAKELTGDGNPQ